MDRSMTPSVVVRVASCWADARFVRVPPQACKQLETDARLRGLNIKIPKLVNI